MSPDVIIIGAGAAGLMCAIEAGKRGRRVMVLDHAPKIAEKIRISGGGRCNFTNIHCSPDHFISGNPHFCRSALKRYSQHDFIGMVERHGIPYHEKTLGQLFCDISANDIVEMLLNECADAGVEIRHPVKIDKISQENGFLLETNMGTIHAPSLVIATGGLSIPKIGASGLGYDLAEQFGLKVSYTRPGLVPLTFPDDILTYTKELSGVSVDPVDVQSMGGKIFREGFLFTHRGISGPSVLQISSYWKDGEDIRIDLCPDIDLMQWLKDQRKSQPRVMLHTAMGELLPKRLVQRITEDTGIDGRIADISDKVFQEYIEPIQNWVITPSGSEGYRTAEVTLGGIDTDEMSSKTFESNKHKGLYFIGEVLDVTGHLGGFNFQWAWSSGWCAGQYV